jgi:hypothetical protein
MMHFFLEGGAGMWPVTLFGFAFVAISVLHMLRPDRKLGQLVVSLGALTLGAGVLGTTMGINTTMRFLHTAPAGDQFIIAATGIAESSNDLILAMVLFVIGSLASSVAGFRARKVA